MTGGTEFKALNRKFNKMPPSVQAFYLQYASECNGCGACKNLAPDRETPFSYTIAEYEGREIHLCHVYKNLRTQKLDSEYIKNLLDLYKFIDDNFQRND